MEQFKIRPNGFKEIRKAMLMRSIPMILLAIFVGFAISYFNADTQQSNVNIYPFLVPLTLIALGFALFRIIKKQKEQFESYRLTIDDNGITKEQLHFPTISIATAELTEIRKNANRSFTVKGSSTFHTINIPSQIENYEKLEKLLNEIRPISMISPPALYQKLQGMLSIVVIGCIAVVYISKDKIIVSLSGTVLLAVLGYSFFVLQKSKNVDKQMKKMTWWSVLVIASIIVMMYNKLST